MTPEKAITPGEINKATQALTNAVTNTAAQETQEIAANQNQLAPGLNTGQNVVGGYNYARNIAPVINPLTTSLVSGANQAIFKQALKDAQFAASENYELAQIAQQQRYRAYQEEQARRNRERRRKAERDAAAAAAAQLAAIRNANKQQAATTQPGKKVVSVGNPGSVSGMNIPLSTVTINRNTPGLTFSSGSSNAALLSLLQPGKSVFQQITGR